MWKRQRAPEKVLPAVCAQNLAHAWHVEGVFLGTCTYPERYHAGTHLLGHPQQMSREHCHILREGVGETKQIVRWDT